MSQFRLFLQKTPVMLLVCLLLTGVSIAVAAPLIMDQPAAVGREFSQATPMVTPISTATVTPPIVTTPAPSTAECRYPIPFTSVQGRVLITTLAFHEASLDATTDVVVAGGTSWWIIGAQNGFYQIWIACYAQPVWVLASNISPNFDVIWNGASLPSSD